MKILVIDDDHNHRRLLADTLSVHGYEVVSAEDGEEGFRKIREERPALVITDVLMSGMDGFQLLREIRRDNGLRDMPVIFYTGTYLDQEDQDLAREIGVSRYLLKPTLPSEIVKVVRDVLEEKKRNKPAGPSSAALEEPVFLKLYNERLVNKLKIKNVEIERARIFLAHIMEGIGDGVVVIGRDHAVVQVNSAAAVSIGIQKSEIIGRKCYELIHRRSSPCQAPDIVCPLPAVLETGETTTVLHTHLDSAGNELYIEITASPVKDSDGRTFGMVETYRNIMEKKIDDELVNLVQKLNETQMHLRLMSITDELTGLRNRRYIMERLEEEFQRARRSGRPLSLMMLDIDHFKQVNDVNGHLFGDIVLKVVSMRIKSHLRRHDLVGRVGGEEFLVVSPDSGLDDTIMVAERVRKVVNDEAICDGVRAVSVALSAGVTMMRENDTSVDMLFSRADTALYKAKAEGRNRVVALP